jgi:mono/diheme cytochrome c family protein
MIHVSPGPWLPYVAFLVFVLAGLGALCILVKVSEWLGRPRNKGPRRMKVSVIAFAMLGLLAAEASACNRCGLFGARCKYVAASTYVAPVVAATPSQNVYVLQNNYPAPLVGQGTSAVVSNGGYQSLTISQFDPTAFLSQSLQLVKAGQDAATLAHTQAQTTAQRALELQAPTVERLAAGQAASQVLRAAGLDPAHNVSGQSSAVVISRTADGQVQVLPLESSEAARITARLSTSTTITSAIATTPAPQPLGESTGLVGQFCGKCHGLDVAAPKGGLFIGDDADTAKGMRDKFYEISQEVGAKKTMPPADSPQPTDEQRAALLNEIATIIRRRSGE